MRAADVRPNPVWTQRRQRIRRLRSAHPHAAGVLAFYDDILTLQEPLHGRALRSGWLGAVEAADGRPPRLRLDRLPEGSAERDFARFVRAVPASATDVLRAMAERLAADPAAMSALLRAAAARMPVDAVAARIDCDAATLAFFPRAFLQPIAGALAEAAGCPGARADPVAERRGSGPGPGAVAAGAAIAGGPAAAGAGATSAPAAPAAGTASADAPDVPATEAPAQPQAACPCCGAAPFAAVLRDEPEIRGRRTLLCSLCLAEWTFPRTRCPACGEERADKRPHHVSESWPHIRLEECGSCRTYIKAIDLRETGLAVPVVDELASVELDLWAVEQGLSKLQTNLLGL